MFQNGSRFKTLFATGTVILIIGLVLQWYPASVIEGLEERLGQASSIDERNKLQGALSSWRIWQITTFQPLSSILFAVSIIILIYSVIYGIFSIASSYTTVKKQEND
ncbi:MAG: hypothetical protein ACUVUF_03490 [Candidatus Bathycorpusculaceae bacterium]